MPSKAGGCLFPAGRRVWQEAPSQPLGCCHVGQLVGTGLLLGQVQEEAMGGRAGLSPWRPLLLLGLAGALAFWISAPQPPPWVPSCLHGPGPPAASSQREGWDCAAVLSSLRRLESRAGSEGASCHGGNVQQPRPHVGCGALGLRLMRLTKQVLNLLPLSRTDSTVLE